MQPVQQWVGDPCFGEKAYSKLSVTVSCWLKLIYNLLLKAPYGLPVGCHFLTRLCELAGESKGCRGGSVGGALGSSVPDASPAIWPFNGLPDHLANWSHSLLLTVVLGPSHQRTSRANVLRGSRGPDLPFLPPW